MDLCAYTWKLALLESPIPLEGEYQFEILRDDAWKHLQQTTWELQL